MNKPNTICRVCGKDYFCCEDSRKIYSWRTMACSPDCFKEYMKRIEEARTLPSVEETKPTKMKKKTVNEVNTENETKEVINED